MDKTKQKEKQNHSVRFRIEVDCWEDYEVVMVFEQEGINQKMYNIFRKKGQNNKKQEDMKYLDQSHVIHNCVDIFNFLWDDFALHYHLPKANMKITTMTNDVFNINVGEDSLEAAADFCNFIWEEINTPYTPVQYRNTIRKNGLFLENHSCTPFCGYIEKLKI